MDQSEPDIIFERPSSAHLIGSSLTQEGTDTLSGPESTGGPEATENSPQQARLVPAKQKTKRNVRFLITEGGDVVSESVRFEKHGMPRSKATEAIECLLAGNERFRKGHLERCRAGPDVVADAAGDVAKPSTVILACSDSRVPPEIICDQGLGDCHVVRVAGNVVNDFVMGSILFAVQHLGCRLVVVLGHSRCSVVASAVQSWARQQSSGREEQSVRTLAEGVQQTLSSGSSASHISPPKSEETVSPFQEKASEAENSQESKPSFFARLCGSCGTSEEHSGQDSGPQHRNEDGYAENRTRQSRDKAIGRHSVGRASVNPLSLLVGAIGGAVETVANSGEHESFKSLVHKESGGNNAWDSDDEDLKRGLAKQDSLEFTRARLAKKKADRKIEHLRELARRADVDSVIDENSKVSAATILKSLGKNIDKEVLDEIEVAAGKYNIEDGSLRILSRSWYANQTYYCTLEG